MPFKKGHPGGPGRPKGSGYNAEARKFAEEYGIPFLIRVAQGKEKDVNMFGKPCDPTLSKRVDAAKYLIDHGIGKAAQNVKVGPDDESNVPMRFTVDFGA